MEIFKMYDSVVSLGRFFNKFDLYFLVMVSCCFILLLIPLSILIDWVIESEIYKGDMKKMRKK